MTPKTTSQFISYCIFFTLWLSSFAHGDLAEDVEDLQYELDEVIQQLEERKRYFKVNGFLSAGVAHSDAPISLKATGVGEETVFQPEGVLGIQMSFYLDNKSQVVTQLVSRGKNDFDTGAEWAYFAYKVAPSLTFRAGRLRLPLYMLSDYLEVGYAYPWVRPPSEVYDLAELFSSHDGMEILYNFSWNQLDTKLQVFAGTLERVSPNFGGLPFAATDSMGTAFRSNYKSFTFTGSYLLADFTADIDGTDFATPNALLQLADAGEILFDHLDIYYYSLGITFDNGNWLVQAETTGYDYEDRPGPQIFPSVRSYYISIAHKFGRVTPYYLYAHNKTIDQSEREEALATLSAAAPGILATNPIYNQFDIFSTQQLIGILDHQQASHALGISYSLSSKAVIKFEWRLITDTDGSVGDFDATEALLGTLDGSLELDDLEDTNVFNLVFDLVF